MLNRMNGLSIAAGVLLMASMACTFGSQTAELAAPTLALPTSTLITVLPTKTTSPTQPGPADGGQVVTVAAPPQADCPDQPGKTGSLFSANSSATTVTNLLTRRAADTWIVHGVAGQKLSLQLISSTEKAYLIVSGANRTLLLKGDSLPVSFSGSLPSTQDYYIVVNSNALVCSNYALTASLTG